MTKLKKVLFGFFGVYLFAVIFPVPCSANVENPGVNGPLHKEYSLFHQQAGGQRIQEIYSQLNLTDGQKKQLESNKQQHRAKMESTRQEMKTNKEALRRELMKSQLDLLKINTIHNQIKSLQDQMEDEKLNSILAVRTILTPDQFLKFVNLMHKHKQEHE